MNLLRPFTGTGAIFFPIGQPPNGTCEFSTEECRKHCYALSNNLFDYETRVSEKDKWDIYNYIIDRPIDDICLKILKELDGLQTSILHWFGTGDCLTKDIDRISLIINSISKELKDVIQMGFTRNIELWKKHKDIFALTIEGMEYIDEKEGLYSISDYENGVSVMYSPNHNIRGGYCGPITCKDLTDTKLEHQIDCRVCYDLKMGCFGRRDVAVICISKNWR